MGTHPIFESDFDCLTGCASRNRMNFSISSLELACQAMFSATIDHARRREAEEFLIEFRDKATIGQCRDILVEASQHNGNDAVKFQAAAALKSAFPRDCVTLPAESLLELINQLAAIIDNVNCGHEIRQQLIQVIGIAVKRDVGQNKHGYCCDAIITRIEEMAASAQSTAQLNAASLIYALVLEFSGTGKSSLIGLSLAAHAEAKAYFEKEKLPAIFTLVLNFLKYLAQMPQVLHENNGQLVAKFLEIGHTVLSWQFSKHASRRALIKMDTTIESPFMPPKSWSPIVTSAEFVNLWFSTHGIVRRSEKLAAISSACIQQVCSMKDIFGSPAAERDWTKATIESIQRSFPNWCPAQRYESAGLSYALKYLIEQRNMAIWEQCAETVPILLECLSGWTVSMIEHVRNSEEYQQGLDYTTDAWTHLVNQFSSFDQARSMMIPFTLRVWQRWLRSKLAAPEGDRLDLDEDDEEICELEETDTMRFDVQLTAIGLLSRMCASQSVNILTQMIDNRIQNVANQIQSKQNVPDGLWEDIHWLYLALGHLVADDVDSSEQRYIPSEIMKCSIESNAAPTNEHSQSTDPVVKIVALLQKCIEVEKAIMAANLMHSWSPQAAQDLRWLLLRFSEAYVYFPEDHHPRISPSLLHAVGRDSDCGKVLLNGLVDFCLESLRKWTGEQDVLDYSCGILIVNMKRTGPKTKLLAQDERIWQVATKFCQERDCIYSRLAPPIQQKLMSVIIYAGAGGGLATQRQMWSAIEPLQRRFAELTKMSISTELARRELIDILERLTGCVLAAQPDLVVGLAEFLVPFISQIGALVDAVHGASDVANLLFKLNSALAKSIMPFLSEQKCQPFFEAILNLLNLHSKWNRGRRGTSQVDDECAEELMSMLDLISNVLNRDVLDFSNETSTDKNLVAASDVALSGLNTVLPLIGAQLLEYPPLAESYYTLLNSLCEIYTEKVITLDLTLLEPLMKSLQVGLANFGNEIAKTALEAICAIAACIYDQKEQNNSIPQSVITVTLPFIRLVFDSLLVHASDTELVPICSECLFYLIAMFPAEFEPILLERAVKCTAAQQDKIKVSFQPVFDTQKSKCEAVKLLESAAMDIRGLLCIK